MVYILGYPSYKKKILWLAFIIFSIIVFIPYIITLLL